MYLLFNNVTKLICLIYQLFKCNRVWVFPYLKHQHTSSNVYLFFPSYLYSTRVCIYNHFVILYMNVIPFDLFLLMNVIPFDLLLLMNIISFYLLLLKRIVNNTVFGGRLHKLENVVSDPNLITFRSTWVQPRFLVVFVLLDP